MKKVEFIIWRIHPETKTPSKELEGEEEEDKILETFKKILKKDKDYIWSLKIRGK